MTDLSKKIKLALDESRMLILGAQILLGFQFRAMLETGFETLPRSSQQIAMIALGLQLVTIVLIMWPSSYHRIVRNGIDSHDVHNFTTRMMDVALLPFIIALTLDFFVMSGKVLGMKGALTASLLIAVLGISLWYGLEMASRWAGWDHSKTPKNEDQIMGTNEIYAKIEHALTEARVVLPGAQALLGFQFATMFVDNFDRLPASSKYCHLISLALMVLTVILLMAPAAYHRIVERGEATEHFHKVATTFLLFAMITLPIGICGEPFVITRHVAGSAAPAAIFASITLAFFYACWFGFTIYRKKTLDAQQRG